MDEFNAMVGVGIVLFIIVIVGAGFAFYNMEFSPIEQHIGNLTSVQYSQSGVGSSDIMVFYFEDGKVLRFNNPIAEVHLGRCLVTYRGNDMIKYFVDIEYLGES